MPPRRGETAAATRPPHPRVVAGTHTARRRARRGRRERAPAGRCRLDRGQLAHVDPAAHRRAGNVQALRDLTDGEKWPVGFGSAHAFIVASRLEDAQAVSPTRFRRPSRICFRGGLRRLRPVTPRRTTSSPSSTGRRSPVGSVSRWEARRSASRRSSPGTSRSSKHPSSVTLTAFPHSWRCPTTRTSRPARAQSVLVGARFAFGHTGLIRRRGRAGSGRRAPAGGRCARRSLCRGRSGSSGAASLVAQRITDRARR